MRVLVTAGSTKVPIDKVRVISNIFKGRTGTEIAKKFSERGCDVTLMTSNPELAKPFGAIETVIPYLSYRELFELMEARIKFGGYDVVIHSAAVSDYEVSGMFIEGGDGRLVELDNSKKISSKHKDLFMKLSPTKKIIDEIRSNWGFDGVLVKFKLEVGVSNEELIKIAKRSRKESKADIIIANCLEWSDKSAFIIGGKDVCEVERGILPVMLYKCVEECIEVRNGAKV